MQLNKRDPYLDTMKGAGILLVILGHLIPRGELWNLIYGFHMPLFLFCSGLVEKQNLKWKRLVKLLTYYVAMAGTACGIYFLTHQFGNINYIKQTIYNIAVGGYSPRHGIYPVEALWFLPSLIIVTILHHAVAKMKKVSLRLLTGVIVACLGVYFSEKRESIPMVFNLDVCLLLFPFFAFAPYCKPILEKIQRAKPQHLSLLVCVLTAVYSIAAHWNGEINVYRGLLGRSAAVFYLVAIVGISNIFCFSVLVCRFFSRVSAGLRLFGAHTLIMMGSHQLFILYFRELLPDKVHPAVLFVFVTAAGFLVSVLLQKQIIVCDGRK